MRKMIMIVTEKAEEITHALSANFHASGTIVNAIGGYSKQQKQIIYFIVNQFQINRIKVIVHAIDEDAYITIQEVADIIVSPNKKDV